MCVLMTGRLLKIVRLSLSPTREARRRATSFSLFALLLLSTLSVSQTITAQNRRKPKAQPSSQKKTTPAKDELSKSREEFVRLTGEYKESLTVLVTLYEKDVKREEDKLAKLKELYAQGLVSKRDVEDSERAVAQAKAKITEAQKQMRAADEQVAQMMVEAKALEEMAKLPPPSKGKLTQTASYIRYGGTGSWLLSESWKIQQFFLQRFGRQLPISAYGQSALHNRWGLDHRNAMDVGVSPDSVEGRALMEFLRANGIPFAAFRGAIPGSATGPHIHIGLPSHRYATSGWQ
ncbi:MAG: TolC family protein [Pyrinomonadaceae bacterium]|nr:TolC family protein [Pyrinomonadaceae bacterium]